MRRVPIDELLWRFGEGVRKGRLDGWQRGFALSLMRHAKRPGWEPSARQERCARRILAEMRNPTFEGEGFDLIDDGDGEGDG